MQGEPKGKPVGQEAEEEEEDFLIDREDFYDLLMEQQEQM